jgi:CxxC motif-containing protein (DUF1111 family)
MSQNSRMLLGLPVLIFTGLLAMCLAGVTSTIVAGKDMLKPDQRARATFSPKIEPGEENPGGSATTRKSPNTRDAFSHASNGIGFEGEAKFKVGNAIFRKLWVSAPASTKSSDGLGPLFNSRSCQSCHFKDGRGHPPTANYPDDTAESMLLRLSIPPETAAQKKLLEEHRVNSIDEPTYGGQLQDFAIQGHDSEGQLQIMYEDVPVTLGDGSTVTLREPTYSVTNLKYGPLHPKTMMSPRVAPPMIGLGLIEAVPEAQIVANADAVDKDGDGISGQANKVWSLEAGRPMLGRFGWKAGAPTIREQSAAAFSGDIGISTPILQQPSGDCTDAQNFCRKAPNGNTERDGGFEVGPTLFELVTFYAQNLAVPSRRNMDNTNVAKGKEFFHQLGCASCHRPTFVTGEVDGQPHLSNQRIWPYTDLLLHDMGEGLADHRPEGIANGLEWRTPPLWGIGLTETVSGHTYFLHDGRARNLEEAILWHGGEAQAARDGYAALSKDDRDALILFVESL